jgi:stearoyl-CoA desaturase (delta-9 desaturase)
MWKTKTFYSEIRNRKIKVDEKFTKGVPDWKVFDDFVSKYWVRIAWGTLYSRPLKRVKMTDTLIV